MPGLPVFFFVIYVCAFVYVGHTVTDVLMSVTYELPTKISGDNLRVDQDYIMT